VAAARERPAARPRAARRHERAGGAQGNPGHQPQRLPGRRGEGASAVSSQQRAVADADLRRRASLAARWLRGLLAVAGAPTLTFTPPPRARAPPPRLPSYGAPAARWRARPSWWWPTRCSTSCVAASCAWGCSSRRPARRCRTRSALRGAPPSRGRRRWAQWRRQRRQRRRRRQRQAVRPAGGGPWALFRALPPHLPPPHRLPPQGKPSLKSLLTSDPCFKVTGNPNAPDARVQVRRRERGRRARQWPGRHSRGAPELQRPVQRPVPTSAFSQSMLCRGHLPHPTPCCHPPPSLPPPRPSSTSRCCGPRPTPQRRPPTTPATRPPRCWTPPTGRRSRCGPARPRAGCTHGSAGACTARAAPSTTQRTPPRWAAGGAQAGGQGCCSFAAARGVERESCVASAPRDPPTALPQAAELRSTLASRERSGAVRVLRDGSGGGVFDGAASPVRPGERECGFYLNNGFCNYQGRCRWVGTGAFGWGVAAAVAARWSVAARFRLSRGRKSVGRRAHGLPHVHAAPHALTRPRRYSHPPFDVEGTFAEELPSSGGRASEDGTQLNAAGLPLRPGVKVGCGRRRRRGPGETLLVDAPFSGAPALLWPPHRKDPLRLHGLRP
jgi:hypothetical protein